MFDSTRALVTAKTEIDYFYRPAKGDAPLLIFLHGFGETYGHLLRHFKNKIPDEYGIFAPNGVFPLPQKKFDSPEWKLRFCWYFFDSATKKYFIDQRYPAEALSNLLVDIGAENQKKIIIGFSQGGYLAPFLGAVLSNVSQTISINAELKHLMLPKILPFELINICGEDDEVVDPLNCQHSHQEMIKRGNTGNFYLVKNTGHKINEEVTKKTLLHIGNSTT